MSDHRRRRQAGSPKPFGEVAPTGEGGEHHRRLAQGGDVADRCPAHGVEHEPVGRGRCQAAGQVRAPRGGQRPSQVGQVSRGQSPRRHRDRGRDEGAEHVGDALGAPGTDGVGERVATDEDRDQQRPADRVPRRARPHERHEPAGDHHDGDVPEHREPVVEERDPTDGGHHGAPAAGERIGEREVAGPVGLGQAHHVGDVDAGQRGASHGNASRAGNPVSAIPAAHTAPAMTNWPHSATKRSSLVLTRRFQPACSAAAASANTVARTMVA